MIFYFKLFIEFFLVALFFMGIIILNRKSKEEITHNKNKINLFSNITIILLVIFIGICVSNKYFQNDTFFTIALGEETMQNGVHNKEVLTYHEGFKYYNVRWLFNVVIALINKHFGFGGIYSFVILITTFTSLALYFCLNKITNKKLLAFIITAISMYFSASYFVARAQIVSALIFIIEYYSILMLAKHGKKRYLYILLILPSLIVNFHASVFPLYLILYLPFIAEHIISKFKFKNKINFIEFNKIEHIKLIYIAFIINIFEGLISPLGFAPYLVMFSAFGGISKKLILEMQPLQFTDFYMLYFCAYFFIFTMSYFFIKAKTKAHTFFLFVGLSIISISSIRNLFILFIVGAFSIVENLDIFLEENNNINLEFNNKSALFLRITAIFSLIILFFPSFIRNLNQEYVDKTFYPVEATEYIIRNIDLSKYTLYNNFNCGAYLEYKGIKTFMDSRSEVYEKNYNNTDILEDFYYLTSPRDDKMDYKVFFDKYNITLALIDKDNSEQSLYENQIKKDVHNCLNLIYEDENYAIYEVYR